MLATRSGGGETLDGLVGVIRTKLEAAEASLAKAQKYVPSQLSDIKSVFEAKSSYEMGVQTRKGQQLKGVAKAAER